MFWQTGARIGSGFSAIGAFLWLLWPDDVSSFRDLEPEPLFAFLTALVVWIACEIRTSEEVSFRRSTENDIRVGRRLLGYHAEQFRNLLESHDFHSSIGSRYISEMNGLIYEFDTGRLKFQNKHIQPDLEKFVSKIKVLANHIAQNTVPSRVGGSSLTSFKNKTEFLSEDAYGRELSKIKTANDLATKAWRDLEVLVQKIHDQVPESLDVPISHEWTTPAH